MTVSETLVSVVVRATAVLAAGVIAGALLRFGEPRIRHRLWAATLVGAVVAGVGGWLISLAGWQWDAGVFIPTSFRSSPRAALFILLAWGAGAAVLAGRTFRGLVSAARLGSRAWPLTDATWTAWLASVAREYGGMAPPRLLVSEVASVPLTIGLHQPAIILPAACASWTTARRRAVLLHELSHVRRRDCAMELLVQLVCAVYWFHPGVWWVARQLRLAREQACDAAVVAAGTPADEYAEHLVALLRSAAPTVLAIGAALGRQSALEARLIALAEAASPRARSSAHPVTALAPLGLAILVSLWSPPNQVAPAASTVARPHAKTRCDCSLKHHRTPD